MKTLILSLLLLPNVSGTAKVLNTLTCHDPYVIAPFEQERMGREIDELCVSPDRRSAEHCENGVIRNHARKADVSLSIMNINEKLVAEFRDDEEIFFDGEVEALLTPGEVNDRGLYFQTEDEATFVVESRMFSGPSWKRTDGATVVLRNKTGEFDMYVFTSCEVNWE